MIVYGTSISPYVRKVLVSLYEKGVPFEHKPVPFHADDPGFQAASPTARSPPWTMTASCSPIRARSCITSRPSTPSRR